MNDLVKQLHKLSQSGSEHDLLAVLKEIIPQLQIVLNIDNKLYNNLNISCNIPDHDLSLVCFISKSKYDANGTVTTPKVLKFLEKYQLDALNSKDKDPSRQKSIQIQNNKIKILKEPFKRISSELNDLIQFFLDLHKESEFKLISYITSCFEHELKFHKSLEEHLLNLDPNQVSAIQNDKLVNVLKNLYSSDIGKSEDVQNNMTGDQDSIFTYQTIDFLQPNNKSQGNDLEKFKFSCSDLDLKQLYDNLLLILFLPDINHDVNKVLHFSRVLVSLYKSIKKIEFFELHNYQFKELKFNKLFSFLMNYVPDQLLNTFKDHMIDINFFPEFDERNHTYNENGNEIEDDHLPAQTVIESEKDNNDTIQHILKQNRKLEDELNEFQSAVNYNFDPQKEALEEKKHNSMIWNLKEIIYELNDFDLAIKFDTKFPGVFKFYLKKLQSYSLEPRTDSYYVEIGNLVSVLSNDSNQTDEELEANISKLYSYSMLLTTDSQRIPANSSLIMRETIFEYKLNETLISIYFRAILENYRIKLSLKTRAQNWETYIYKSYLKKWFNKLCRNKLLYEKSIEFHNNYKQFQCLKYRWMRKFNNIKKLRESSLKIDEEKYFINWVYKAKMKKKLSETAIEHYNSNLIKKVFTRKFLLLSKTKNLSGIHNQIISKFYFLVWLRKIQITERLKPKVLELRACFQYNQTQILFNHWIRKTTNQFPEIVDLNSLSSEFILTKFLRKWSLVYSLAKVEDQVSSNTDRILLKFFFSGWLKRLREREIIQDMRIRQSNQLKRTVFLNWRYFNKMNIMACDFHDIALMKNNLSAWILKHKKNNFEVRSDGELIIRSFNVWRLKVQQKNFEQERSYRNMMIILNAWAQKNKSIKEHATIADNFEELSCLKVFFKSWRKVKVRNHSLSERANYAFLSKAWSKTKAKYHQTNINYSKAIEYNANRSIKVFFDKWQDSYDRKYNNANEKMVRDFRAKWNANLLWKFLDLWYEQYVLITRKKEILESHEFEFTTLLIVTNVFDLWRKKTHEMIAMEELADQFNRTFLLKKHLLRWFNYYLFNEDIVGKSNEFKADADIKELEKRFGIWSMKILKINRNRRECESFKNKWNMSQVKGILNLWKYKVDEKMAVKDNSESQIYYDPNSDVSPLANKHPSNSHTSYLDTPLKRNRIIAATPERYNLTSRLSVTAERKKKDRLDALKNHYRKAKPAVSINKSPHKAVENLKLVRSSSDSRLLSTRNSYTRLSPPKQTNVTSKVRISSPPKQPIFSNDVTNVPIYTRTRSISPTRSKFTNDLSNVSEVTSRDNIQSQNAEVPNAVGNTSLLFPRLPSPSYDTDAIETAKKLRRITPIFVPSNEEEPKFSPVNKLKERVLLNRSFQQQLEGDIPRSGDFRVRESLADSNINPYTSTPIHNRMKFYPAGLSSEQRESETSSITDKLKAVLHSDEFID